MKFILLFIVLFCLSPVFAADAPVVAFAPEFPQSMRAEVGKLLLQAWQRVAPTEEISPLTVEWAADKEAFGRRVGKNPEHLMAAANWQTSTIILNGEAFRQADPSERLVTIIHEYVHLLIGQSEVFIPLWLEEGLAMHVSGDLQRAGSEWQLTAAHSFDRLIPIREIDSRFPEEPARRSLAYRQAYSLTGFVLERDYPITGAAGLLDDLLDEDHRVRLEMWTSDRMAMHGLELAWRKTLGSVWAWIAVLGSGTVFWGLVTALFLYAYFHRKKRTRQVEEKWKEEDAWMESIPDSEYEDDEDEK